MRAKPISSKLSARAALLALALFSFPLLAAQDYDLQTDIDATTEALSQLDSLANGCLQALDAGVDAQAPCDDFMSAIDGALVADFLQRCRNLRDWRDDYVDSRVSEDLDLDGANSTEILQRLIAIEFSCGENSLVKRTEFVAAAFNRLRSDATAASAPVAEDIASLNRRLAEDRLRSLDESERLRLLDALRSEQNRSTRESERQFDDLQAELLRQQIRNANRPPI